MIFPSQFILLQFSSLLTFWSPRIISGNVLFFEECKNIIIIFKVITPAIIFAPASDNLFVKIFYLYARYVGSHINISASIYLPDKARQLSKRRHVT